uniref:Uncharacterized protein n=1 Tax=Phenylobacterium glaciei TaxID=2803784 RepID=A0A974S939_9CAUL|nr:hypothetical protein JKL49_07585 [Phenylobacterium glaciei]
MASGSMTETSMVGRDSGAGFVEAVGSQVIFSRVIVQVPGVAWSVSAAATARPSTAAPPSAGRSTAISNSSWPCCARTWPATACTAPTSGWPAGCWTARSWGLRR